MEIDPTGLQEQFEQPLTSRNSPEVTMWICFGFGLGVSPLFTPEHYVLGIEVIVIS